MKRATARDVADLVGCSISAVSLVINKRDKGRINPELRDRILAVATELDYRPNETARGLAIRKPTTVALVCPDIRNPFFGSLFHGLVDGLAGEFGVDLKIGAGGEDYGPDAVREAQAANIAGLILANPSREVMENFRPTGPTLLVDSPGSTSSLNHIDLDLEVGTSELAAHLLALGHTAIGYVDFARPKDTFSVRRRMLETRLREGGAQLFATASAQQISVAAGQRSFENAWPEWNQRGVTAVIAADDVLAYGVLAGARAFSISVPDDLSVASFNDIDYSALTAPPLTSVAFNATEVGAQAGRSMRALIAGQPVSNVLLRTALTVRASTALARQPSN